MNLKRTQNVQELDQKSYYRIFYVRTLVFSAFCEIEENNYELIFLND